MAVDRNGRTRVDRYRRAGVDVRVHPRFSDAELIEYLTEVDVAVLPYVFGTHSGWVEACHDAGTTVVTPDCGFFTEQHGTLEYGYGPDGLDAAGLHRAVTTALADPRRRPRRRPRPSRSAPPGSATTSGTPWWSSTATAVVVSSAA